MADLYNEHSETYWSLTHLTEQINPGSGRFV